MSSNHSKVFLEWLHWQHSQLSESSIQHTGNVGEYRIQNTHYTVDGFDPNTNTVYEFRLEDRCADDVYRCTQKKIAVPTSGQRIQRGGDLGM